MGPGPRLGTSSCAHEGVGPPSCTQDESPRQPRGLVPWVVRTTSDVGNFLEKIVGVRDRRPDSRRVDFVQFFSRKTIRQRSLPHGQSRGKGSPPSGVGAPEW